jgi:hypothetical protein
MVTRSSRRAGCALLALVVAGWTHPGMAAPLADGPPGAASKAGPPRGVEVLERVWPGHPEWVAMFVDILQGSQLGPKDGWFRKGVAQSRFRWPTVSARLDVDHDGAISRTEFAGPQTDFDRLDRDRDGALTAADFDFSAHALTPTPGAYVFARADRDGNGKVTREELAQFFQAADSGGLGYLSLNDLQDALGPRPRPRPKPGAAPPQDDGPTRMTLVRGLFRQEIGSLQPGPALESPAPDFTLTTVDGAGQVTLSKLVGRRPVVLIFGNFTCGPFRNQAGNVEKLFRRHADRATFVMVYVREAHPTDGWQMESNERVGVALRQPRDYLERVGAAQVCTRTLGLGFPVLVDTMDDRVGARYSGMPSRLYLIDRQGRVAYKSSRGPFGFKPAELEQALLLLLRDEAADSPAGNGPD